MSSASSHPSLHWPPVLNILPHKAQSKSLCTQGACGEGGSRGGSRPPCRNCLVLLQLVLVRNVGSRGGVSQSLGRLHTLVVVMLHLEGLEAFTWVGATVGC
jgi:hypothetical protein